jgi:hypothetical protein
MEGREEMKVLNSCLRWLKFTSILIILFFSITSAVSLVEVSIPEIKHGIVYDSQSGEIFFIVYATENYDLLAPVSTPTENAATVDLEKTYHAILTGTENRFAILWVDNYANKREIMELPQNFFAMGGIVEEKPENEKFPLGTSLIVPLQVSLPSLGYKMGIVTDSFAEGVKFILENRQLYIKVSGEHGSTRYMAFGINDEVCPPEQLEITVDGQAVGFELRDPTNVVGMSSEYDYAILINFTLSSHVIGIEFGAHSIQEPVSWYTQPLSIALIVVAVVIVIGALYWLKFRK